MAWNAQRGQPLGQTVAHLFAAFGSSVMDASGQPQIEGPAGQKVADFLVQLAGVSPPDIAAMAWDQRTQRFAEGKVAMTYGWSARALAMQRSAARVAQDVRFAPAPHAEGESPITPLGVWYLGIPANLPEGARRRAQDLLCFLGSRPANEALLALGNGAPARVDVLQAHQNEYPWFRTVLELAQGPGTTVAHRPAQPDWYRWAHLLGSTFHDILWRQRPVEEMLSRAQKQAESWSRPARREEP